MKTCEIHESDRLAALIGKNRLTNTVAFVLSGYRGGVNEIFILLGFYAA